MLVNGVSLIRLFIRSFSEGSLSTPGGAGARAGATASDVGNSPTPAPPTLGVQPHSPAAPTHPAYIPTAWLTLPVLDRLLATLPPLAPSSVQAFIPSHRIGLGLSPAPLPEPPVTPWLLQQP